MNVAVNLDEAAIELIAKRAAEIAAARIASSAEDRYLDVSAAAQLLSCSKSRIYSLVSARRIPHHKDGSRVLFKRSELEAWIESGGASAP